MSVLDFIRRDNGASTQRLLGVQSIKRHSIQTSQHGHLVYFTLEPVNLAVLSRSSIQGKVSALMTVIKGLEELELLCMGSREYFEENKAVLQARLEEEREEKVRRLLEKDLLFLDQIQIQTASAREFLLCLRFQQEEEIPVSISRVEKLLKEQGFRARLADQDTLKRLFSVYFTQNMTQVVLDDYDGQRWANVRNATV